MVEPEQMTVNIWNMPSSSYYQPFAWLKGEKDVFGLGGLAFGCLNCVKDMRCVWGHIRVCACAYVCVKAGGGM